MRDVLCGSTGHLFGVTPVIPIPIEGHITQKNAVHFLGTFKVLIFAKFIFEIWTKFAKKSSRVTFAK